MYNPTLGRWIQEDPIELEGGDTNLYRYVGNGPTNAVDPFGLAKDWLGQLGEVVGGIILGQEVAYDARFGDAYTKSFQFANQFQDERVKNAALHAYWQAYLSAKYHPARAAIVGDLHELRENCLDSLIDQYNNPIGRDIGTQALIDTVGADKVRTADTWAVDRSGLFKQNEAAVLKAIEAAIHRALDEGKLIKSWADPRTPALPGHRSDLPQF